MIYQIGQLADIIDGDRGKNYPKQNEFFPKGYCLFLNAGNVTPNGFSFEENSFITQEKDDLLRKGKLQRGDIVYTTRGTVGNAAFYSETIPFDNIRINSGMVILRCNEDIVDKRCLYQILKSEYFRPYFKKYCTGSAQPQLPIMNFSKIELNIPEIDAQRRIADILSSYDDLIENNRKQIKLLEEAAQRLYKEWFVDLRFPGHEHTKIVDSVPEGWEPCIFDDVIEFDPKVSLDKDRIKQFVPMSALSTSSMVLDMNEISEITSSSGSKFQNGDTLLARITPCLENGKTAFVHGLKSDEGAVGSTEYIVMRSKKLNPYMVYLLSRTNGFRQSAINSMSGSDGRQRVKADKLKALAYLLPPAGLIHSFEQMVSPMFKMVFALNKQIFAATQARDRLLPKLMSGEVEV